MHFKSVPLQSPKLLYLGCKMLSVTRRPSSTSFFFLYHAVSFSFSPLCNYSFSPPATSELQPPPHISPHTLPLPHTHLILQLSATSYKQNRLSKCQTPLPCLTKLPSTLAFKCSVEDFKTFTQCSFRVLARVYLGYWLRLCLQASYITYRCHGMSQKQSK